MTPRLSAMSTGAFSDFLRLYVDSEESERATAFFVTYLKRLLGEWEQLQSAPNFSPSLWWAVDRMTKYINLWHGTDIGGLGYDVREETPDYHKLNWRDIAAETIRATNAQGNSTASGDNVSNDTKTASSVDKVAEAPGKERR